MLLKAKIEIFLNFLIPLRGFTKTYILTALFWSMSADALNYGSKIIGPT